MTCTIDIPSLGIRERRVTSYRIESQFLTITDGFEVVLPFDGQQESERLQIIRGVHMAPIEISIDGNMQMVGRVDVSSVGRNGRAIMLRGRDYLADLQECNVDPNLKLEKGQTLGDAVLRICSTVGINEVRGDDGTLRNIQTGKSVGAPTDQSFQSLKLDDYKPQPGMGLAQLAQRVLSRHGYTVQPTESRTAVSVAKPNYLQPTIYGIDRVVKAGPVGSTILDSEATRDYSSMPTFALFTGKQGAGAESRTTTRSEVDVVSTWDTASPGEIRRNVAGQIAGRRKPGSFAGTDGRLFRLLYFRDEQSRNQDQLDRAAIRAVSDRIKDSLRYTVTIQGHTDPYSGATWAVDTKVRVYDEICDVREDLWIASRVIEGSSGSGKRTSLECWRPGSFVL